MIIYSSPDDKKKNRGFCFLEYESHKVLNILLWDILSCYVLKE